MYEPGALARFHREERDPGKQLRIENQARKLAHASALLPYNFPSWLGSRLHHQPSRVGHA